MFSETGQVLKISSAFLLKRSAEVELFLCICYNEAEIKEQHFVDKKYH